MVVNRLSGDRRDGPVAVVAVVGEEAGPTQMIRTSEDLEVSLRGKRPVGKIRATSGMIRHGRRSRKEATDVKCDINESTILAMSSPFV